MSSSLQLFLVSTTSRLLLPRRSATSTATSVAPSSPYIYFPSSSSSSMTVSAATAPIFCLST
ncbi:hypothetical protein KSP39_PZI009704 [Platanthera zijinensis]|uniref:Uncharacterized protein n=1 Tax=Platanthera zijinensis TaxID=2320716 RepID=A0AAP0BIF6_9ASPA